MALTLKNIQHYFIWTIIIILLISSYFIIQPFIVAILSAIILAYLIKPVYNKLSKKIPNALAAFISVIIVSLIIIVPITFVTIELAQQTSDKLSKESLTESLNSLLNLPLISSIEINPETISDMIFSTIISVIKSMITSIPFIALTIVVTTIGVYYILQNWDSLIAFLEKFIPFKDRSAIKREVGNATKNIVYGYMLIALIEFAISSIGFYLSGIKFFILLPIAIAILAFIPGLGPMMIWVPVLIVQLASESYASAMGVLITGLIVSVGIDNILAPKIVGSKSKIHPFIMLLGILGGVSIFGIFGVVIGPLILIYTIKILQETTN